MKKPELITLINEVGGGTAIGYKASKLTFYNVSRNRRLGLPEWGVTTDLNGEYILPTLFACWVGIMIPIKQIFL